MTKTWWDITIKSPNGSFVKETALAETAKNACAQIRSSCKGVINIVGVKELLPLRKPAVQQFLPMNIGPLGLENQIVHIHVHISLGGKP